MPTLEISTNIPREKVTSDIILTFSKEVATCLGKPEQYVTVRILPDQLMSFGGTTEPCGTAQLLSIGKLGVEENKVISAKIFALVEKSLGIPNDRMQIMYWIMLHPPAVIGYNDQPTMKLLVLINVLVSLEYSFLKG